MVKWEEETYQGEQRFVKRNDTLVKFITYPTGIQPPSSENLTVLEG